MNIELRDQNVRHIVYKTVNTTKNHFFLLVLSLGIGRTSEWFALF